MSYPGVFCISLDFELHWGCFERMSLNEKEKQYFLNTRALIPEKLNLFSSNEIHATWAVVGMLYMKNASAWHQNKPTPLPEFINKNVSAYDWIDAHGFSGDNDPFHFAPDLVDLIRDTPYQEIATHTYAHYFCLEPAQTRNQFYADLEMAVKLAAKNGSTIRSLVFPRNQFNANYLSVCANLGITSVRSSPNIWYWRYGTGSSFKEKFFRAGDAYIKMQPIKPVYLKDIDTKSGLPLQLPSSRLYRAWQPKMKIQNTFKLHRILNEMTVAAKNKAYYHIWWHPHNFGFHPKECMHELEQILDHFKKLNKKYGFQSMSMEEISSLLLKS